MIVLRPYQREALDAVYAHLRLRDDNPCVVLPTGSGKTPLLAQLCHDAVVRYPGHRVLVLSHVKELLEQAANHLASFLPANLVGLHSAGLGRRDTGHPVIVAGIQTVFGKAGEMGPFDFIVVDECFVAGTLVKTPCGDIPIEDLRIGNSVYTALGIGEIEGVSIRGESDLIELELDDGTVITCTRNHPFLTPCGWLEAGLLETGTNLYCQKDMRLLRERIRAVDQTESGRDPAQLHERKSLEPAEILLDLLLEEAGEPHAGSEGAGVDETRPQADSPPADSQGRKWAPSPASAIGASSCLGSGLGSGACDHNRDPARQWDSPALQGGHRECGTADRDRAGRRLPWQPRNHGGRHAEGGFPGSKRVARIAHIKRDRPAPVYNLHVSGHPSYYADGVLVHNCHLIPESGEGRYLTFLRDAKIVNPNVRVIGLTATPFRLGSGLLCKPGNILNHICYDANVKELILQGWLCPLRTKRGVECADMTRVGISGTGEFASDEMQAAFEAVIRPACAEIAALCAERKAVLIFAAGVEHARLVADMMGGEVVTGDTSREERAHSISRFRAGKIKYLVNVNVLTTGFDAPNVDAVVLLRATLSPGLYCQMVGRGLRKHPGKADCLVLDYGDNALRHGPIDRIEVRDKRAKDKAEEAPGKMCPNCREMIAVQYRICPVCEYEFPSAFAARHNDAAGDAPILSDDAETFERPVLAVLYSEHVKHKDGGPSVTLRVQYLLNEFTNQTVSEFLCFNHPAGNFGRQRAETWWKDRSQAPVPATVMDALALARRGALAEPRALTLIQPTGKKYPEIVGMDLGETPPWDPTDEQDEDFFAADPVAATMADDDIPF